MWSILPSWTGTNWQGRCPWWLCFSWWWCQCFNCFYLVCTVYEYGFTGPVDPAITLWRQVKHHPNCSQWAEDQVVTSLRQHRRHPNCLPWAQDKTRAVTWPRQCRRHPDCSWWARDKVPVAASIWPITVLLLNCPWWSQRVQSTKKSLSVYFSRCYHAFIEKHSSWPQDNLVKLGSVIKMYMYIEFGAGTRISVPNKA